MINERVGMGMSMNFAHPVGKVTAVLGVLLLLSLPVLGGWMMAMELTPVTARIDGDTLVASQLGTCYEIDLEEIESVRLLETLPASSRVWGTGMPNLLKGTFSVDGYGTCELCLDPTDPPFLLVKTTEKTYLLGAENLEALIPLLP